MNLCKKDVERIVNELVEKHNLNAIDRYKLTSTISLLDENPERTLYVFEMSDKLKEVLEMHNYNVIYESRTGYRINYIDL